MLKLLINRLTSLLKVYDKHVLTDIWTYIEVIVIIDSL